MSFSDSLFGQLTGHNVDLLRFDAATRRRIRAQLFRLQQELATTLGGVDFSSVARQARLESLYGQVDKILSTNYRGMRSILSKDMQDLAKLEQTFAVDGMNNLFKVDIISAALTPEKLRAIASNSNIVGAPARKWWSTQAGRTRNAFQTQIRQGFLLGESTGDLVRRIRGTATGKRQLIELANGATKSVHVFEGGIMQATTREAEALVRTSVQSVANEVRFQTYRANKDVIKSLQAQVTLDAATSEICQSHGAIPDEWDIETLEPIGGSNPWSGPPPWHFQCRSSLIPITKSWQELQDQAGGGTRNQRRIARKLDNNAPKRLRSSMNGQVPRGISFDKWLKTQPKSVQLDLLGPSKRKLWKDGRLSLSQTLDQTGRPLSVGQIKTRIGRGVSLRTTPTIASEVDAAMLAPDSGIDAFGKTFNPQQVLKINPSSIGSLPVSGLYTTTTNGIIFQVVKKSKGSATVRRFSKNTATMVLETNKKAFRTIKISTKKPSVTGPVGKPPPAIFVDSTNYRTLKVGDVFKDAEDNIWKVRRAGKQTVSVQPWDPKTGKFLSTREGKTLGFSGAPAKTVKQFQRSTTSTTKALDDLLQNNTELGRGGRFANFSARQTEALGWAKRAMGENGFNKELIAGLNRQKLSAQIFPMGKPGNIFNPLGMTKKSNAVGAYWSDGRALGMVDVRSVKSMTKTWVHEFGHHMDYALFREGAQRQLLRITEFTKTGKVFTTRKLSTLARRKLDELNEAYTGMIGEYKRASNAVGKKLNLRLERGVMSEVQQKTNYWNIHAAMRGHAQSSYSLYNEKEWFAETFASYFNQGGSRARLLKISPETHNFFEMLFSTDMELLWKELLPVELL